MSMAKKDLAEQELKRYNQDKKLISVGVKRECKCGITFEPEKESQYLCPACLEAFNKS